MLNDTMLNIVAKYPWVFSFYFFFVNSFFLLYQGTPQPPYFLWNSIIDKGNISYFVWKKEYWLSKIKEGVNIILNPYLNLSWKVVKNGRIKWFPY